MYILRFRLLILLFVLVACEQKVEQKEIAVNLQFGHRGSGADVYNGKFIENTLPSVQHALEHLDGCEIDIQTSSSGTIWVYHDDVLGHFCNEYNEEMCIPMASDEQLSEIKQCRGEIQDRLYKLEEILQLFSLPENREKFISLDVKGYFKKECFEGRNASKDYFEKMSEELCKLIDKYNISDQVIVETGYTTFLDMIRSCNPNVRCHIVGYTNFDERISLAIEKGYQGVSFSLYDELITREDVERVNLV